MESSNPSDTSNTTTMPIGSVERLAYAVSILFDDFKQFESVKSLASKRAAETQETIRQDPRRRVEEADVSQANEKSETMPDSRIKYRDIPSEKIIEHHDVRTRLENTGDRKAVMLDFIDFVKAKNPDINITLISVTGNDPIYKAEYTNHSTGKKYSCVLKINEPYEDEQITLNAFRDNDNCRKHLATRYYNIEISKNKLNKQSNELEIIEFISNGDLSKYFPSPPNNNGINSNNYLDMAKNIISMINTFNKEGFYFLDIKPGNFLIDDQGKPKLADTKTVRSHEDIANGKKPMGTQGYETGKMKLTGNETDQIIEEIKREQSYLIGITLYEAVTGHKIAAMTDRSLDKTKPHDFQFSVYENNKEMRPIMDIIKLLTNPDPVKRLTLDQALAEVNKLNPSLENAKQAPVSSTFKIGEELSTRGNTKQSSPKKSVKDFLKHISKSLDSSAGLTKNNTDSDSVVQNPVYGKNPRSLSSSPPSSPPSSPNEKKGKNSLTNESKKKFTNN